MRSVEITSPNLDSLITLSFKENGEIKATAIANLDFEKADDILAFIWKWNDLSELPSSYPERN